MFEFPLIPLVHVADIRMGQSPDSTYVQEGTEQGVPFLQGNAEFGVKYPTAKYSCIQPPRIAEPGSSLISVRAPVGETNIADQTYCIGRGLSAVSFHRYGEVLGRELLNFHAKDLDKVSQGTTFAAISGNELKSLLIAEIPEQEAAVLETILDTLDTQIQKTEALIAKLEQVKEGLLHDLLTRGIDENGQLRPSPEQAPELYKESPLGLIPIEWEVGSLGELSTSSIIGPFGSDLVASDYRSEGVPVVFVRDVVSKTFTWKSEVYVDHQKAASLSSHDVVAGDVLLTKMGLPPCIACTYL